VQHPTQKEVENRKEDKKKWTRKGGKKIKRPKENTQPCKRQGPKHKQTFPSKIYIITTFSLTIYNTQHLRLQLLLTSAHQIFINVWRASFQMTCLGLICPYYMCITIGYYLIAQLHDKIHQNNICSK